MMLPNLLIGYMNMHDINIRHTRLICARDALHDGGTGVRFSLPQHSVDVIDGVSNNGQIQNAFAIAFQGQVYAYQNCCPHLGTELDWQPGEVFDETGLYLICATHGAAFEPDSGRCIGGPCLGASLKKIAVKVENNQVVLNGVVPFL